MKLTARENALLLKARALVNDLEQRASDENVRMYVANKRNNEQGADAHDLGRFSEACSVASDAIFNVLNISSSYLHLEIELRIKEK